MLEFTDSRLRRKRRPKAEIGQSKQKGMEKESANGQKSCSLSKKPVVETTNCAEYKLVEGILIRNVEM